MLIWNAQNGWPSFKEQGGRLSYISDMHPEKTIEYLGEQLGIVTPLLFGLLIFGVFRLTQSAIRDRDPASTLLVTMFLVSATFFLFISLFIRVEANWPAFMWPPQLLQQVRLFLNRQLGRI